MNMKQLAAFYLKFFHYNPASRWVLADNAPVPIAAFTRTMDTQVVREALSTIATGKVPDAPSLPEILELVQNLPVLLDHCDALLSNRQPPKTVFTLFRSAYLNEVGAAKKVVSDFLQAELDKY